MDAVPTVVHRALERPWVRTLLIAAIVFDVGMLSFNLALDRSAPGNARDSAQIGAALQREFPTRKVVKVESDMIERLKAIWSDRMRVRVVVAPASPTLGAANRPSGPAGYQLWQCVVERGADGWAVTGELLLLKTSAEPDLD